MAVVLATTLQPFRAHIAAGVLHEHGIPAWVWQDLSSSGYTPLTSGGCQLVVGPDDADEASKILNALPANQPEEELDHVKPAPSLSLATAIGSGVLHGAFLLPVLLLSLLMFRLALSLLGSQSMAFHLTMGQFLASIFALTMSGIIWGAMLGLPVGVAIWLLSAWRNGHPAGTFAICLFATALCLLTVLMH